MTRLRVLLVEDSEDDAAMIVRNIRRGGFDPEYLRVDTPEAMKAALAERVWDVITCDFVMPHFSGPEALNLLHETGLDVPLIVVSGNAEEAAMVDMLRTGARDYVVKGKLSRLVPALEREIRDAHARRQHKLADSILREAETRFQVLVRVSPSGIFYTDAGGDCIYVSERWCAMTGLPAEAARERGWAGALHPDDRERIEAAWYLAAREKRPFQAEYRFCRTDGRVIWVLGRAEAQTGDKGQVVGWVGSITDITDLKAREEQIRRLNRVYAVLSGINNVIVRIRDRQELFADACRIAVEAGGFVMAWIGDIDHEGGVVRPLAWAGDRARSFLDAAPLAIRETKPGSYGLAGRAVRGKQQVVSNDVDNDPQRMMRAELTERGIHSLAVLPLMLAGEAVGVIALYASEAGFFDEKELALVRELADDISFALDHIEKEERVHYLAYHDPLTGLANRSLLHERLAAQVIAARERAEQLAPVIINIDRFKIVNDTLGRQAADELLRDIARRLSAATGDGNRVARVGADEFAVTLPQVRGREHLAQRLTQGLERVTREPFVAGGRELRISFRSGVALFPADGEDADALFRNAEAALRRARCGEGFVFYEEEMSERNAEKLELENRLRLAVERREFVLYYQPKLDLATRRITGVEALIRWQSPELGLVPPAAFIPMLEETGLIRVVGSWALARAVEDQSRWHCSGRVAPRISVNVSAVELRSPDFVAGVKRALAGARAPAIDLEITETLLMEDVERSVEKLKQLRELGVGVAIDDFGTGYSSLGYLARLPAQALKIDRSFIVTMLDNEDVMTLVSTIVSLAHALRLTVVAEGVDSEAQARALYLLHCDEVQGYLFGKPMPFDEMSALLARPGSLQYLSPESSALR
jgi:diguanylate cyclase (GGDEF)-like protein/PAS domain S-box-containing protein